MLESVEVDAILLDLGLPDGFGIECVDAVRAGARDTPVVVLTGIEDEKLALSCIAAGAQDYLWKNEMRTQSLRHALGHAIARVRLQKRNDDLVERDGQMRALVTSLNAEREEERLRLSNEVQDEIGQLLTAVKLDLSWIARNLTPTAASTMPMIGAKLARAEGTLSATISTLRRVAFDLRPSALAALGLGAAVCEEARRFERRTGLTVQIRVAGAPRPGSDVAVAFFRIFQRLLANIERFAHATSVHVVVDQGDDELLLRVEDDGRAMGGGADEAPGDWALGLLDVRERAETVGGTLTIRRTDVQGTIATVRAPCPREAKAAALGAGGRPPREALSPRESEIVRRIALGCGAAEIAHELDLSRKAVSAYVTRIRRKTGLTSDAEITRYALARGLVELTLPLDAEARSDAEKRR